MTPRFLRVLSFAKVNLALSVLDRRPDGYHEIRTVFQAIDLCDELQLSESDDLRLQCSEIASLPTEENLVWKAAIALRSATGRSLGADMILRKRIPAGSGLGGGSSNAAAALLGLSRLWNLGLDARDLTPIARQLGSDVPFFLDGGTALGVGRGDEVYPMNDLPQSSIVVVCPGIHISTADAYRSLSFVLTRNDNLNRIQSFCSRIPQGPGCWSLIFNDFETSILPAYPAVREAMQFLSEQGAAAVLLSGSGSGVFGFFSDEESASAASRAVGRDSWRVFPAKTLSRAEYSLRMFG